LQAASDSAASAAADMISARFIGFKLLPGARRPRKPVRIGLVPSWA
jgi:hypothetical protein